MDNRAIFFQHIAATFVYEFSGRKILYPNFCLAWINSVSPCKSDGSRQNMQEALLANLQPIDTVRALITLEAITSLTAVTTTKLFNTVSRRM
jgi:hypothetical protein